MTKKLWPAIVLACATSCRLVNTHDHEEVRILIETDDAQGVQPMPHFVHFLLPWQVFELIRATVVNSFGL